MTDRLDQLENKIKELENRLNKLEKVAKTENTTKSTTIKPQVKRSSNSETKTAIVDKEVKCEKCKHNLLESTMFIVSNGNIKTYECMNEKECDKRKNSEKYEQQRKLDALLEGNKHLPKEEQFEALFNLKYDDLIELPERYRDASIHYSHKNNGKKYSWSWASKTWRMREF